MVYGKRNINWVNLFAVYPAQNGHNSDDNFFSNDDDYDPFAEDPLVAAFEGGSEIWEDK